MKLSPMMQQYNEIKEKHKDHILFFRLGDFYEMFFDDAKLCSKELDLTLTGRDCGQEDRAPMCGVPHHSCEAYISRLIKKGYKVAICEQIEKPQKNKSIVARDVVRIITPGTVIEKDMLEDDKNNYISSLYFKNDTIFISFCDISTGYVTMTNVDDSQLYNEISRFMPTEVLLDKKLLSNKKLVSFLKDKIKSIITTFDFDENSELYTDLIKSQFDNENDSISYLEDKGIFHSIGGLISYLKY
ncbi:MAG: DNA mismatch repair protein MutS, partial [Oscillospiraceae bacterium]